MSKRDVVVLGAARSAIGTFGGHSPTSSRPSWPAP